MNKKEGGRYAAQSGALVLTVSTVIVKLLGVIYKIPLMQLIGEEGMGYFNSAYTVYTFFYLLCTAGVPKAIMIVTSEARGEGKYALERRIIKVASSTFFLLGISLSACFAIFSAPLSKMIGNSKAAFTMLSVAPSIAFIALSGVIRGALSAKMKFSVIAVSQIVEASARLGFGLVFAMLAVRWNMTLPIASAFTILGATLGAFFGLICLLIGGKTDKTIENIEQKYNSEKIGSILKRIFSISLPITFGAAAMSITGVIDLAQIMRALTSIGYSEAQSSGLYGNYTTLAVPIFNLAVAVITPISVAYLPIFTRARAEKNNGLLNSSVEDALSMSAFLCAPITVGVLCYSKEILYFLFGKNGIETGAPLLVILIPTVCFTSLLLIVNTLLEALGCVKIPVIGMLLGSTMKLIIGGLLLKNPHLGIIGAPIGTLISYFVSLLVSLLYAEKKCRITIPFIKCSLPYYLTAAAAIIPTVLIKVVLEPHIGTRLSFLGALLVSGIVYLLLTKFFTPQSFKRIENRSNCTKCLGRI